MSIAATEMRYQLGYLHRALLRAGVMGLSAVTSAECSRDLRCAAHVPQEVPVSDWFNPSIAHHILCRSKAVLKC